MFKPLPTSLTLALLLGLGCAGSHPSGDHPGTLNWALTIVPGAPYVIVGQTIQFQASTPWGGSALWSVQPSSAGTITPGGLFTAGSLPATCTLFAMWSEDVRYTASATVTILAPPPPAASSANYVEASGAQQTSTGGAISNGSVVGEDVQALVSSSANQTLQVRHGFLPPGPVSPH